MLIPEEKINIQELLKDLEHYHPRRKGWTWREKIENQKLSFFKYEDTSKNLKHSLSLPASRQMFNLDPQPNPVITVEIASGRLEDDIRRMRMAAWHGADHIMVIRTLGQSHFDGLIEGTPEGVGGIPITRKQIRATRKALDLIEDEVGRPINLHSYVSGIAGPEIAVLFSEEGINGAHQDPQYNILYRNINPLRSFVDAAEAKLIMSHSQMLQIDGAHNANATAKHGFMVMPELLVQHGINCMYSLRVGMDSRYIALSTVPPSAPPFPALSLDLPYAVAVRELFSDFRFRAQMNTKYIESCAREATVNHTLNTFISAICGADIQSTITPDEGRNVPWHYNSIHAVNTAKQTLIACDGIRNYLEFKEEGPFREKVRELKERAVLFLEEIKNIGGYFKALEAGFFVDSGYYPERVGDGIKRPVNGGNGANSIILRENDYLAPVCYHFGDNHLPENIEKPCDLIDGCSMCYPGKIQYIDELDEVDNVETRLSQYQKTEKEHLFKPEVQWRNDGIVLLSLFLPLPEKKVVPAARLMAQKLGLINVEVIHKQVLHPAEGSFVEVRGEVDFYLNEDEIEVEEKIPLLSDDEIRQEVESRGGIKVIAATLGEDEHSVGLKEVIDVKHGGIEKWGFEVIYLGTSVPPQKVIDSAMETGSRVILASTTITHGNIHQINLKKLTSYAIEKGVRDQIVIIGGGTQLSDEIAQECGLDTAFGRGTKGIDVASFIIRSLKVKNN
ncbi:MAG: D-ornithine 4,5-aminomutase subunit beta [candidate division WS2 bacterium]|nr:D-ornithine 4,5-aminomutase subunit beta [Candidatus Lithacetigena glycinireducens]